jgi:DNA-binding LacI/PurR family transcriptional regulator
VTTPARDAGRTKIRDVAAAAGVSVTTVSHALSGKGRVDPDTAARVREAAQRLGYSPNAAARNLRRGRSGLIGLLNSVDPGMPIAIADLDHFVRLVDAAAATALARGYMLVLAPPADPVRLDSAPIDAMVVLDPVADDPALAYAASRGIPVVSTGRDPTSDPNTGVWVDNDLVGATTLALDHLARQGAQRIGLVVPPSVHSWGFDMLDAYRAFAARRGQPELIAVVQGTPTETAAADEIVRLLGGAAPPDALHCVVDRFALGALLAAARLGLRVPEDLLITSGTDSEAMRTATPPVTALDLRPAEIGAQTISLLIDALEHGGVAAERVIVATEFVERGSTARSPASD